MQALIKIYPIANGKTSAKGKNSVLALVLEDGTERNEITNTYESASVMCPGVVSFWVASEIFRTLKIMTPVEVIADISVRGESLSAHVKKIMYKGNFISVSDKPNEEAEG